MSDTGLEWAHPLVRDWFVERFGTPTEPQAQGWPAILDGRSTLISAPTGSGKTLAAFLACIDQLVRAACDATLDDRTRVLYVSPLKALGNDIQRNLDGPLADIAALARARGLDLPEIRTAVRTGDTLAPARRAMLKRPPHILVTTPESLFILLTAERSRAILRDVRTVIVDEIHAVADDKRGAHLTLSLERLERLAHGSLTRIGLSATQKPLDAVARFLAGAGRPAPVVVEITPRRSLDVGIEVPPGELGAVATHELWADVYDRIAALVREHRSTLVFVNTRRLAERVSHHLAERLGAEAVAAHHGSLSRTIRLDAERRLKHGELRVLVATASLELGIDIGTVDLVCHVGSPRAIAVALQRIGRAGHWRGAVPKGRFFATTRDELVECAALVLAIRAGELDALVVPATPLDVLAQQIVAMCAVEDWDEDELFAVVRRSAPYASLDRRDFDDIVSMLSEGIAAKRGRYAAFLHRDAVNHRLRGRRGARLAAITSGGAIPDTGLFTVVLEPEGTTVGTVDEDFAVESQAGDVMLLGNTSWRIRRVTTAGRVLVEDAHGAAPTIPFWRGEAPARTAELSQFVSQVRETVDRLGAEAVPWLVEACGVDGSGAEQIVAYVLAGRAALGAVPTLRTIVAERFFDEGGGMQLVIHSPLGARINKAWGLALRKRFCRSFNFELQASATDNGINIALAEQHSFPLADVFGFLRPATAREVLEQAALPSPLFGTRWRWDASRALALLRFQRGRKVPIHILRLQSDDLLASVFPDVAACQENIEGDIQIPDHPLIREVMKDVLTEAMDLDGWIRLLEELAGGAIRAIAVDSVTPSVFAHEILAANPYAYLDDAPIEERRARAVDMRRVLPETLLSEIGRLDANAIAEVRRQAWPDVRHADDLHDALLTFIAFPCAGGDAPKTSRVARAAAEAAGDWTPWFEELLRAGRTGLATTGPRQSWVAAERARAFQAVLPNATFITPPADISQPGDVDATSAAVLLVQGWLSHMGPASTDELAHALGLDRTVVEDAALRLEASGWALRGTFDPGASSQQWCERRLLARIHRLTLGTLRREIAPVPTAVFMQWLFAWQHVAAGTQTRGEAGTLEVLRQLQGLEAPARAWERDILPRRVTAYDPADLDRLSLSGVVGWGRLSRPAASGADGPRRVIPTSVTPVTFFVRDEADWLPLQRTREHDEPPALSRNARAVHQHLRRAGASFFPDIVRGARLLKAEIEMALWELVAAGLVTADGFDNLRALLDPRRRAGRGSGRHTRPRNSSGRWALLEPAAEEPGDRTAAVESACWMVLRRYGVVFREILARESNLPTWRELLLLLRRLEDRGEVRGGRFVDGLTGEQFALPIALESLRAFRRRATSGDLVTIAAADPLNLVGTLVPGERVPVLSDRTVTFRDGVPVVQGCEDPKVRGFEEPASVASIS